ncbi:MAG: hypothetical protein AMXMBFR23_26390 [Chloroflexota bacterium]
MGRYSYSALTTLNSPDIGTWIVTVYEADGGYYVVSDALGEHGYGATKTEAARDFCESVMAYRAALECREATLGPELTKHLELIRRAEPRATRLSVHAFA